MVIEDRASPSGRPRRGEWQLTGARGIDERCAAYSPAEGLLSRLCAPAEVRAQIGGDPGFLFAEIASDDGARSALTVACRDPDSCLALAEALTSVADGLIASGATFSDVLRAKTGVGSDEPMSPETVERLVKHLSAATSWVSGFAARSGDAIEARLCLAELDDLRGSLRVRWGEGGPTELALELIAALPEVQGAELRVWPESARLGSRVRSLWEPRLGDDALDDALHVTGDLSLAEALRPSRDLCLRLAQQGADMTLGAAQLCVQLPSAQRDHGQLHGLVEEILLLWRDVARQRAGFGG